METYCEFAKSSAGHLVGGRLKLDLTAFETWDAYAEAVGQVVNAAIEAPLVPDPVTALRKASTGETVVLAAAMHAAGFPWIADQILSDPEGRGGVFFSRIGKTDAINKAAVLCCLTRQDSI